MKSPSPKLILLSLAVLTALFLLIPATQGATPSSISPLTANVGDVASPFQISLKFFQEKIAELKAKIASLQQSLSGQTAPSPSSSDTSTLTTLNLTKTLYRGVTDKVTGGEVSKLQQFLASDKSIYPEGLITGFFGPLTEKAVQRWQLKHGVVASPNIKGYGVVGPLTRAKISQVAVTLPPGTASLLGPGSELIPPGTPPATPSTPNTPPRVNIVSPTNNVTYNSPASFDFIVSAVDPDGTISKIEFYQNGSLVGSATGAPYAKYMSNLGAGDYYFTAYAYDNQGARTISQSVNIKVIHPGDSGGGSVSINRAPEVSITAPTANNTSTSGTNVTVSASSSDPDGSITQVQFFASGTSIGTDTTSPYSITWTPTGGVYSLTAVATDNQNATTTSAAITATVNNPPSVSITAPTANNTSTSGTNVTVSADSSDTDGSITQVQFFASGTSIGTDTTSPYSITWTAPTGGVYSLTARATDSDGATTTSAAITATVNNPPSVSITAPSNNGTTTEPFAVTVSADSSDTDGSITQVQFFASGTSISTDTSSPYSITWDDMTDGVYSLTARATDSDGATTTSAAITATVKNNLVLNPKFSLDPTANNWVTAGTGGTFSWANDQYYSSPSSTKIVTNSTTSQSWRSVITSIAGTAGNSYTAKARMRATSTTASNNISVSLGFYNSAQTALATTQSTAVAGNTDWTQISVTDTAPANTAYLRIHCNTSGVSGTNMWCDDGEITQN